MALKFSPPPLHFCTNVFFSRNLWFDSKIFRPPECSTSSIESCMLKVAWSSKIFLFKVIEPLNPWSPKSHVSVRNWYENEFFNTKIQFLVFESKLKAPGAHGLTWFLIVCLHCEIPCCENIVNPFAQILSLILSQMIPVIKNLTKIIIITERKQKFVSFVLV